eukprot:14008229-Alexandrium_andersonii.AAC.1
MSGRPPGVLAADDTPVRVVLGTRSVPVYGNVFRSAARATCCRALVVPVGPQAGVVHAMPACESSFFAFLYRVAASHAVSYVRDA